MTLMQAGWQLMLYGLGGTFFALVTFYLLIKGLVALANRRKA